MKRMVGSSVWMPLLLRDLRAHQFFLLAQLGAQSFAEIFRREHLSDFDFLVAAEWRALHPFDRLIERFGVDEPETADKIAGERERSAADAALPVLISDPRALGGRMQALARLHHAGLAHFLVELAYLGQQLHARHHAGFRILAGLHNHHESHRYSPV